MKIKKCFALLLFCAILIAFSDCRTKYREYHGRIALVGIAFAAEHVLITAENEYFYFPPQYNSKLKRKIQQQATIKATTELIEIKSADYKYTIKKNYFKKIKSIDFE